MNILAGEQKKLFEQEISEMEREKRNQEFLKLYYYHRDKEERSFFGKMTLKTRKKIHWLILLINHNH